VNGKTLRGSRRVTANGEVPGRHLLVVIDQHTRTVLGQLAVDGRSNEITVFTRLLERLTVWVPETVHTALDLLLRRQPVTGMIHRWRYN
jgi:hypothetical protein